jgi:hypothetical protein
MVVDFGIFDSVVTGDLFDLRAGSVGAAFGYAMRDRMDATDTGRLKKLGIDTGRTPPARLLRFLYQLKTCQRLRLVLPSSRFQYWKV